jgi:cytochrome c-type biogenesis protein CcsB
VNYESYSYLCVVSSVVVFLIALTAHAVEWASARRLESPAEEKELATVGASGRASAAGGGSDSAISASTKSDTEDSDAKDSDTRNSDAENSDAENSDAAATVDKARHRVEAAGRIGVALTVIAFLLSVAGVVLRGLAADRLPWGNMFEFTTTAIVFVVGIYLALVWRSGMRWLGLPLTLLAAIGNGLAVTVFYVAVAPLVPALHSVWFIIHIVAAAVSGAAFNIGGVLAILYLVKQRSQRLGRPGGYLERLPDLRRLDLLGYRFLAFAFPLWTFTVAAGAIWAEYAWGRYWGWDPKETWALVTWVIYACYLHARATAGWKGTRVSVIAIIGLASFWFNFVGINIFVSGLHSYGGL